MSDSLHPFLARLEQATNDHDVDAVADCFTSDYSNDTPVHPARGFQGNAQVRSNWRQIFAFVPDITARVQSHAGDARELWSEWEMRGTRMDGTEHLMRGVIVFGLRDGRACSARLYLEPVDDASATVAEAVRDQVHAGTAT